MLRATQPSERYNWSCTKRITISIPCLALNQRNVSAEVLTAYTCPGRRDVLKTNISLRSEASRAYMLVSTTLKFEGELPDQKCREKKTLLVYYNF